jgi:hypothetical protein
MEISTYLPGCFHNVVVSLSESLPGFLLRLANSNGYRGLRDLFRALGLVGFGPTHSQLLKLAHSHDALETLGRVAAGQSAMLLSFKTERLPPDAVFYLGCRMDSDALFPENSAICFACLRETGICHETWDISIVTACTTHKCLLADTCPSCGSPITWARSSLFHCVECGIDFRTCDTEISSDAVCRFAEDAAALAPFRVCSHADLQTTVSWDDIFRVVKTIALSPAQLLESSWPSRLMCELPVALRHRAVAYVASNVQGRSYQLETLGEQILDPFRCLNVIPRKGAVRNYLISYLHNQAGLMPPLSTAIVDHAYPPVPLPAPNPLPRINGRSALLEFLGIQGSGVDQLIAFEIIREKASEQLNYDSHELTAAKYFLREFLITPEDLSAVCGVPVDSAGLHMANFPSRWDAASKTDDRVLVEDLIAIQLCLARRALDASAPDDPESLEQLCGSVQSPYLAIATYVRRILSGQIVRFRWDPPYQWSSIRIGRPDLPRSSIPGPVNGLSG